MQTQAVVRSVAATMVFVGMAANATLNAQNPTVAVMTMRLYAAFGDCQQRLRSTTHPGHS